MFVYRHVVSASKVDPKLYLLTMQTNSPNIRQSKPLSTSNL